MFKPTITQCTVDSLMQHAFGTGCAAPHGSSGFPTSVSQKIEIGFLHAREPVDHDVDEAAVMHVVVLRDLEVFKNDKQAATIILQVFLDTCHR